MKITSHAIQYTIRSCFDGALATQSIALDGYPHNSWIQLCTDFSGYPVFLISHLAEHTKNLQHNPRCSLLVSTASTEINSPKRLTILGQASPFKPSEPEKKRFLQLLPNSEKYLSIGGFEFYRLIPEKARLISGFGMMGWINSDNYQDNALASLLPSGFPFNQLDCMTDFTDRQIIAADAYGVTIQNRTGQIQHIATESPITHINEMNQWLTEVLKNKPEQ